MALAAFNTLFPRARRSQQIADDLKNMIGSGELCAGRRIPTEAEMCQHYGVSRTTVREALQTLRSNGVLDVTPGRGSYVRKPDPAPMLRELALVLIASGTTIDEVHAMHQQLLRNLLVHLAQPSSHTTPAQRQELYQHVVNRQAAPADNVALENRWHLMLVKLSGQTLPGHVVNLLLQFTQAQRTRAFGAQAYTDTLAQAQMRLTSALCEGDYAAAERLLPTLFIKPVIETVAA
ncbi:MAG TPA: GntR family transcriptional regulator [Alphaproteobacteria bacterium]|nr:GntR family transcriptional regulator [Alphaproteobacteria bacterium]